MTTEELIQKIDKAEKFEDVISSVNDFKAEYTNIAKEIHPDRCSLPGTVEATTKLNGWKDYFENGKEYKDECGAFRTNGYWAEYKSSLPNMNWSVENYRLFQQLQEPSDKHFLQYLPRECKSLSDGTYKYIFEKRAIPISGLSLSQEHVNWVLNRLFEYAAYLSQINFVHCGFTPESVFIVPETHGVQITSFYHLTRNGAKIGTIAGKYKHWYPQEVFSTKLAFPVIDLEMAKRIAVYLLGEQSGNAVRLRKTHNEEFINFLLKRHNNAYECLTEYREMLKKNFPKKFHLLTI